MKPEDHLWRSSPRRTKPSILEKTFVGDEAVVARLVEQIEASAATANKHYGVIVGGAGTGKSHTLAVVVGRVRKRVPKDELVIAWLPDDPSGLASPLHLFEAILASLGASPPFPREAAAARAAVVEVLDGRTMLLCVEGLDRVLSVFGGTGQRELRAFLQQERCCALLGTARELTADFTDQARPFFGFFGVHRLEPIDAKDVVRLLAALARARGDAVLATKVRATEHRATFGALHHMLGGVPQRYTDLLREARELDEPDRLLLRALDDHAARDRVARAHLSPQQRLILGWLSRQRGAVPVKEIARACAISEQTVSPQLRALRKAGFVTATKLGRESWCEVRDPLSGIDVGYALDLFRELREWFAGGGGRFREVDAGDPRAVLALPRLERALLEPSPSLA